MSCTHRGLEVKWGEWWKCCGCLELLSSPPMWIAPKETKAWRYAISVRMIESEWDTEENVFFCLWSGALVDGY